MHRIKTARHLRDDFIACTDRRPALMLAVGAAVFPIVNGPN